MSVYIAKRKWPLKVRGRTKNPYQMSHMITDDPTLQELRDMVDKLGLDWKHFQDKPNRPHYDITQHYKNIAIKKHGAILVTENDIINILRRIFSPNEVKTTNRREKL